MQFLSLRDAQARLLNTLIVYNDQPFYVDSFEEPALNHFLAIGYFVKGKKRTSIDLSRTIIDPPKFYLGYTNTFGKGGNNSVLYLQRSPERNTKMGLASSNSTLQRLPDDENDDRISWSQAYLNTPILNLYHNTYINIRQMLEADYGQAALSREFAVSKVSLRTYAIYWEQQRIGELQINKNKTYDIELYPPYSWVKESLTRLFKQTGDNVDVQVAV